MIEEKPLELSFGLISSNKKLALVRTINSINLEI